MAPMLRASRENEVMTFVVLGDTKEYYGNSTEINVDLKDIQGLI